ncbi:ribosome recycling factor [Candidatus Allofournierella excrementigallinarum]|uniref:ribosome recycling factor n=1 Tax=Candidatus Allofournierella excrementigallinarum TaxID=2838592 RepID=UPI00374F3427
MSEFTKPYEDKMDGALRHLDKELVAIRAGRANPAILDRVTVDYYGSPTPINQMAAVAVAEARILTITPWDSSLIHAIEHALLVSDIGINPTDDGRVIRLVFPAPTEERRRQLTKDVQKLGEETKVAVRNVRRDAMDKLKAQKKNSEITEDDQKNLEEEMQKITDKYVKLVDKACEEKNKEIMEI